MDNEIICYCSNVTKADIIKALDNGAKTLKDIQNTTGACTKGLCKEMFKRHNASYCRLQRHEQEKSL